MWVAFLLCYISHCGFFSFSWPGSGPRFFRLHKAAEFEGMDKKRVFEIYISGMLSSMGYFILQHLDCFSRESAGKHGGQKINKTEHGLA